MTEITKKNKCCGCGACANICPAECIAMSADDEGFLYPVIGSDCTDCGKCRRVCPVINVKEEIPFEQVGYAVQNKNESILRESTSGGAFSAIAEYVIENGGVVFGAAFDDSLTVRHVSADNVNDLALFRGSKYVQSDTGSSFSEAKKLLDKNIPVCFSGTPCQIEGLLSFLGRPYDDLITVDLVCRAVPSPLILKKYLRMNEALYKRSIGKVFFRDKEKGYKYSTMNLLDKDKKSFYRNGIDTDAFLRAFFSNICDRPSCYNCSFKKRYRDSDITLWDCFESQLFFPEADNDKGVTRVLIHSEKGRTLFENIRPKLKYKQSDPDLLVKDSKEMTASVEENPKRAQFFKDAAVLSEEELFGKYFPVTFSVRFEKAVRLASDKLGIYKYVRRAYKKLFGDRKR